MTSEFIDQLSRNTPFNLKYDPFGIPNEVVITGENSTTCIATGNDNFKPLLDFIDSNGGRPLPKIQWCQVACNAAGEVLHYRTDEGNFVDDDNPVTRFIKAGIASGEIELQPMATPAHVVELQAFVFLPRAYGLSDTHHRVLTNYTFGADLLGLPFQIRLELLQSINAEFFMGQEFLSQHLKNLTGNVLKVNIPSGRIKSIFNWSIKHLDIETSQRLMESRHQNIRLNKRSDSQGPTTEWYFEWRTSQHFLQMPILEVTNRLLGLMNLQAHRKTAALFSGDDLGDVVCLKTTRADGSHRLSLLSSLRDQHIKIFPSQLNWQYRLLDQGFSRVRYLLDRNLHFEAILVAQAVLEAIVNSMFTEELMLRCYGRRRIKWEEKYGALDKFCDGRLHHESHMVSYLKGGLTRIYEIRNKYGHDMAENKPSYEFNLADWQEISSLLKPMVDTFENFCFQGEIQVMFNLRLEFWNWLASRELISPKKHVLRKWWSRISSRAK